MPAATRLGDSDTGGAAMSGASPDVFTNGRGQGRIGDPYAAHGSALAGGSSTVYVNGKGAGRVGDPVSCGDRAADGSSNVFMGG